MKILIINLAQSTDRLEQQKKQFNDLNLDFERLPAVSIHDFSNDEYRDLAFNGQRQMKQSELACFLSHRKAWEIVLRENEPCVILEDDAVLVQNSRAIFDELSTLGNIDYVNLEVAARKKIVAKQRFYDLVNSSHQLYEIFVDRNGAGGYLLYPSGASILLKHCEQRSIGLVDEFIHGCYSLKSYQIEPAAVIQSEMCERYGVDYAYADYSVIGAIKNNKSSINLPISVKLKFKKNRILAQILLAMRQLSVIFKSKRREIAVDSKRFKSF